MINRKQQIAELLEEKKEHPNQPMMPKGLKPQQAMQKPNGWSLLMKDSMSKPRQPKKLF